MDFTSYESEALAMVWTPSADLGQVVGGIVADVSYVELAGVRMGDGDPRGALNQYRKALTIREALVRADPANALARQALASVLSRQGSAENQVGDHQAALKSLSRAEVLLTESDKERLPELYARRVTVYRALGRTPEALKDARRAVEGNQRLLKAAPENRLLSESLVGNLLQLGDVLSAAGTAQQRRAACDAYAEASRVIEEAGRRDPNPSATLTGFRESARTALGGCAPGREAGSN